MDKSSRWIVWRSGLPGLEAVWLSILPRRPPTLNDVAMVLIVPSQCRVHCPVVLPGTAPVVAVYRSRLLSGPRGSGARTCAL